MVWICHVRENVITGDIKEEVRRLQLREGIRTRRVNRTAKEDEARPAWQTTRQWRRDRLVRDKECRVMISAKDLLSAERVYELELFVGEQV